MVDIAQFRFSADNLGYLIHCNGEAMVVDGGAVDAISDFLKNNKLDLKYVTNTHDHPDHTPGNAELLQRTKARHLPVRQLISDSSVHLGGDVINVLHTPGHTMDSICFYTGRYLISGDTLFNGTIGNCFSNDLKAFFRSLKRLMELPENTIIYAGHDYVRYSITVARSIEPDNPSFIDYLSKYDPSHVFSTLGKELEVNPYLRFNADPMVRILQAKGLRTDTEFERFRSAYTLG